MQTSFSIHQLADPATAEAEKILRKCMHCGFCTATCPTYVTLGNELDSPRGRIYLIKDMLENGRAADRDTVTHIDRCLSCLACTTTCPSGVDYMHLIDHARAHVERTYRRPLIDRTIRGLLALILPHPKRFRVALTLARFVRPFAKIFDFVSLTKPIAAMLALAPQSALEKSGVGKPGTYKATGNRKGRVAILTGCVQPELDPAANKATIALLTRIGVDVVVAKGEVCCGSLAHHMGRDEQALAQARANVDVWTNEIEQDGLDAIIITASGCGTTIKDYGHMLRLDPAYAGKAAIISILTKDITEYLSEIDLPPPVSQPAVIVAYHSACSMQHGQKIVEQPKMLLRQAGFEVRDPKESHLCCGSAGTYNILQPDIAKSLRDRKVRNIETTGAEVIATGNIGCIKQIGSVAKQPVLHTVKLLDWAYGGNRPSEIPEPEVR